ncbi:MAG: hypothetical protein Q7R35_04930 [Elusimicrobiota bacterium]|nr:hypothetical protein [Elusimicrobiota bacterium]
MAIRFFPTLFLSLHFAAAPCSAAPALSAGFFDGAGLCAGEMIVPEPPAAAPQHAGRPIVISIVGIAFEELGIGKLEIGYFGKIIEHFKPGASLDKDLFRAKLSSVRETIAMEEAYLGEGAASQKIPDDYLDSRLMEILPNGKYDIVPVRWSRDPDESEAAVPVVEAQIIKVFAAAKAEGRPVFLVAHSWGTVLAHTVLNRLAVSNPEVKIDKLITLGSPLVPGSWWMKIFMKLEINAGQLQQYVSKPANTAYWVNLWAKSDYFSNVIDAADVNLLKDTWTARVEEDIWKAVQQSPMQRPNALRDLFFLKSMKTWHFAYIYDFSLFSKTLQKKYEDQIFKPVISAELAY